MNSVNAFPGRSTAPDRLATIRRIYFYSIAFISLLMGLVAVHNLLGNLLSVWTVDQALMSVNDAGFIRNAVARSGGLLLVAAPIFLFHWAYMQAIARSPSTQGIEERHSTLRKLFLYAVSGVTLTMAAVHTTDLLTESTVVLLGGLASEQMLWPSGWTAAWLNIIIHAAFLAYFSRQLVLDGDLGQEIGWAGTCRRLFQTITGLAGLWLLLSGGAAVLEAGLRVLFESVADTMVAQVGNGWWSRSVAGGVAFFLVGALLWRINWRCWDILIRQHDVEARTALRRFYLYAATVLSAAVALIPAAGLLNHLLQRLFGAAVPADLPDLAGPLSLLPLGVVAWRWHWRQVDDEAARYGDAPESVTVRRLYYYLVAAVGLVLLWIGLVDILRAALDWLLVGANHLSTGFRAEQLANGLSLLAVGAPIWSLHWRTVQSIARQSGTAGQSERASGPRRAYLYGVALAGALLILFEFATVLYRLLLWLSGDPNADLTGSETLDSLVRSGTAIVFWIVHVLAIRQDTRLAETTEETGPSPEAVAARRAALEAQIQRLEEELAAARSELARFPAEQQEPQGAGEIER